MEYIYKADDRDLEKTGIYRITTNIGPFYIGKAETKFKYRFKGHIYSFENLTCNRKFKAILDSISVMVFEIIQIIEDKSIIPMWESCWINCFSHPDLNVIHPKCYGNNIRCVNTG